MIVKGAFEKAKHYIETHSKDSEQKFKKKKQGPCITISRETGAGADKVSEALVEFFKPYTDEYSAPWMVFDKNLIEKVIEDHHLPRKLSQYFVEDKLSEIRSIVNELLGLHPNSWILINKTSNTILQLAQIGNCIIVGRAGNVITSRLKNSFHVRLVAPIEDRIEHIMDICDKSRPEAIEYIKKEDLARKNYLKKYFKKDVEDPLLYNMILNTSPLGYQKAAEIIGKSILHNFPQPFYVFEEEITAHDF